MTRWKKTKNDKPFAGSQWHDANFSLYLLPNISFMYVPSLIHTLFLFFFFTLLDTLIPWLAIPVSILLFFPGAFYYRRYIFLAVFFVFLAGESAQPVFLAVKLLDYPVILNGNNLLFRVGLACFSVSDSTKL